MGVAAIVVNRNAVKTLGRTLDALEQQTLRPDRIIVVDNASTDGSAETAVRPGVELIRLEENVGFAAANNTAAEAADDCEWLALVNADAFPEPRWLETLLAAAVARPDFTFFGSRLVSAGDADLLDGTGDVFHVSGLAWRRDHGRRGVDRADEEIFSPCAAAALYRRDVFLAAGGFDERFFCYYEDTDLAFRLRLAGHRCLYVHDAVCAHVGSASAGRNSDFTVYHSFRNQAWTFAKNMPAFLLLLYLPQHALVSLLTVAAYARRGQATVVVRAKWDAVCGLRSVLRERRTVQRRRSVGAVDLRRVMARGPSPLVHMAASRRDAWSAS